MRNFEKRSDSSNIEHHLVLGDPTDQDMFETIRQKLSENGADALYEHENYITDENIEGNLCINLDNGNVFPYRPLPETRENLESPL